MTLAGLKVCGCGGLGHGREAKTPNPGHSKVKRKPHCDRDGITNHGMVEQCLCSLWWFSTWLSLRIHIFFWKRMCLCMCVCLGLFEWLNSYFLGGSEKNREAKLQLTLVERPQREWGLGYRCPPKTEGKFDLCSSVTYRTYSNINIWALKKCSTVKPL